MTSYGAMTGRVVQGVRALYYTYGFGRRFPMKARVERWVRDWERANARGDVPKPAEAWEAQYRAGQWDYIRGLDEVSRYAVIIGYLSHLKPRGSVLDVGCGDGALYDRFRPYGYRRYVGVDISATAVAALADRQDDATRFEQADAETYEPDGAFDAIVFNESLYYLGDPLAAVRRYAAALQPDGVFVVSMYLASRRSRVIVSRLRDRFHVIESAAVSQGPKSWECLVLARP